MPSPTHFLALPLHRHASLIRSLASFRTDITSPTSFALPEDAVRPAGTLHLTLGVMHLPDQAQVDNALNLLRQINISNLLRNTRGLTGHRTRNAQGGLKISLKGVSVMGSADKTSVMYAPPLDANAEDEGVLYSFCNALKQKFIDHGIMSDDGRPLLLHATVINTIYVKNKTVSRPSSIGRGRGRGSASTGRGGPAGGRGRGKEKLLIDARDIMARYDDFVWAENIQIGGVVLYKMGAREVDGEPGEVRYIPEGGSRFEE